MEDVLPGGDGLYAVCCLNSNIKDVTSIQNDFGKHGNVVSVRQTNKDNGWIFIRFQTAEEAKSVLADTSLLKDYSKIRMARQSSKPTEHHTSSDQSKGSSKRADEKENNVGKQHMKHKILGKNVGSVHNGREFKYDNYDCGVSQQSTKTDGNASNGQHFHKINSKTNNTESWSSEQDGGSNVNQQRDVKQDILEEQDLVPPPLEDLSIGVCSEDYSLPVNVVIANIPPGMRRVDIYHLLGFLQPIYISPLQVTGIQYNLQYCHVYLHNMDDAITAELELNGFPIGGRYLIVKQYEKFFQEVS